MLPITRVVLFKHGVAYFQRTGEVQGNQLLELDFKASQMNDVLKSLTALDFSGGSFSALAYDSEEPLERRLQELNIRVPERGAIAAFLDLLKGAQVEVPRGEAALQGAVVGIEEVTRVQGDLVVQEPHLAVLADGGKLVRVPLLEVDELSFLDESVQRDLKALLDILFSGLRKDRKRLSIQTLGDGDRKVNLSYVVEAPVWKTSYRIILPEKPADESLLQGWALVDNTTEDDWDGVDLSLVAGLPISFVHDLYTPRYRQRPVVRVEEEAAVAPPVVESGELMEPEECYDEEMDMMCEEAEPMMAKQAMRMRAGAPPPPAAPAPSRKEALRSSVQVQTRTQEVGDLFAYEITNPVDVPRGRSALVPILQAEADIERVALYNPEIREKNPMTAFRIKNGTGLTLEGGPLTVFEGEAYVGEAMLDTMRQGEERITPYSVELGITVKKEQNWRREDYMRASKSGTYIYKHYRQLQKTEYEFNSRLDREVKVYLDHRFSYNVREDTPEPVEVTDSFWRFLLDTKPKKKTEFSVTEVSEQYESVDIESIAHHEIRNLVDDELISEKVKQALDTIADKVEQIQKLEEKGEKFEEQADKIESGQDRVRKNLKALGNTSEEAKLRQKYVAKLSKQEERIEGLRAEIAQIEEQVDKEREALAELIETLEL